jgi:DNA repair exonuclease SbcCD ATPase subunit
MSSTNNQKNINQKNTPQNAYQDIDLDIDNYELDDLLQLFHLNIDFNTEDLRQAKRMVMQTHPDKSKLPKDYFLFFSSAFKIVHGIHQFRGKSKCPKGTAYILDEKDKGKEKIFNELTKNKNFNKIFNELFEKNKIAQEDVDTGYGEWLQSNEDIDKRKTTRANMNEAFERKKHEVQAIIKKPVIEDANSMTYNSMSSHTTDLTGDAPEHYSSGLFSTLQYEDLKKAHVESVIPVTMEDYAERKRFNNENEIKMHRDTQNTTPKSLEQANEYLNKQKTTQDKTDVQRAFKLAKQDEAARKANQSWMSGIMRLT